MIVIITLMLLLFALFPLNRSFELAVAASVHFQITASSNFQIRI